MIGFTAKQDDCRMISMLYPTYLQLSLKLGYKLNHHTTLELTAKRFYFITDVTQPEINFNFDPLEVMYRAYMSPAGFEAPDISDNAGLKLASHSPSIISTDIIAETQVITYKAEDFSGNVRSSTVTVEVIGIN